VRLTPARRRALDIAAMFTDVATGNVTDWNGRAYAARITDAGRAALEGL